MLLSYTNLRFADDVALFPNTRNEMKVMTEKLNQWGEEVGRTMNIKETKILSRKGVESEIIDNNSIIRSINSISQKSKFYRRATSRFLYTRYNQCGIFYLLYRDCELKILCVGVKLAYLGVYFTEKHAKWRLT